jgi:plasmid stabilization system protein ParE
LSVVWSPDAVIALDDVARTIEDRRGTEVAAAFKAKLELLAERSGEFPFAGRIVPEFGLPQIRERMASGYRLIYRIVPGGIEVVTLFHGARNLGPDPD